MKDQNSGMVNKKHYGNNNDKPGNKMKLVSSICDFIRLNPDADLSLDALEDRFKISRYQIQKTFKEIMGITPKKYVEECRIILLKNNLKMGMPVPKAVYMTGQNSQSWLSTSTSSKLGMGTREYRNGGKGITIKYLISPSNIGMLLVAETDMGICSLNVADNSEILLKSLHDEYPSAILIESSDLRGRVDAILGYLNGDNLNMPVALHGTEFQLRVWTAIRTIPYGQTRSYSDIAEDIGMPKAYRAVANACGSNPVPLIIPCHRVIRKNGAMGGYALGEDKKKFLLELEKNNKDRVNSR